MPRLTLITVLSALALLSICAPSAMAQDGFAAQPEELWEEFPLDQAPAEPQDKQSPPPEERPEREQGPAAPEAPAEDPAQAQGQPAAPEESGGGGLPVVLIVIVGVGLLMLLVVARLVLSARKRRRQAEPPRSEPSALAPATDPSPEKEVAASSREKRLLPPPEPVQVKAPAQAEAKHPAPVEAKQPEPVQAKQPEPVQAKQPEPVQAKVLEPVEFEQPEPVQVQPPAPVEEVMPPAPVKAKPPVPVKVEQPAAVKAEEPSETPEPAEPAEPQRRTEGLPDDVIPFPTHPERIGRRSAPSAPQRALGYVSAADADGDSSAIEAQTEEIRAACVRNGFESVEVVRDFESHSGSDLERPGLIYALERLEAGEANCLVVASLERLTRSAAHLGTLIDRLGESEIRLVVLDIELDTSNPDGRLAAEALANVGTLERKSLDMRTRKGLQAARDSRRSSGRPAVADRPGLKERIAEMRSRGLTLQAIADTLNAEGVPTLRGGAEWRPSSVQAAVGYKRPKRGARKPTNGSSSATNGSSEDSPPPRDSA